MALLVAPGLGVVFLGWQRLEVAEFGRPAARVWVYVVALEFVFLAAPAGTSLAHELRRWAQFDGGAQLGVQMAAEVLDLVNVFAVVERHLYEGVVLDGVFDDID